MAAVISMADNVQDSDNDTDLLLDKSDVESPSKPVADSTCNAKTNKRGKGEKDTEEQSFWKWLFKKPWSKLPFMYFLMGVLGVPALAVFHFMDADTCYIICGAYIALSIFGLKHFYTLIGMKQEVDAFGGLNKQFQREQRKLQSDVSRIAAANENLRESRDRIQAANAKNRENLNQFNNVQETMKKLNLQSMEELKGVTSKVNAIGDKWKDKLIEHERDMLHTVFDRFELASGKAGMTKKEFEQFAKELPESYQARFARLGTFENLSHDGVHLNFADFNAALDLFAEMDALDCDIEFTIDREQQPTKQSAKQQSFGASVLEVEQNMDIDEDELGTFAITKRWKTQRKHYRDNVKRKVVVHKKVFRTQKAHEFTSVLGLADIEDEAEEKTPPSHAKKPRVVVSVHTPQESLDDDDAAAALLFSHSPGAVGREKGARSVLAAGRMESVKDLD
eukprot:CAMPEP_0197036288 /NCGR_PEP_ID=MMETSP1384-20130603/13848_1 /TAXON_ID=29189 /ORGANISM="Ammonia sp." /LENGTH=449 /DNA_ID=CAMNT_0042466455 /DNA_START=123 /DNA_END=1472 /DNA_ORIENTATION=+